MQELFENPTESSDLLDYQTSRTLCNTLVIMV
jgi:hypothetical protein